MNRLLDWLIKLSQPQILKYIVDQISLPLKASTRHTPVSTTNILQPNASAPNFDGRFHYRWAIWRLNFIYISTRPWHRIHQSPVRKIIQGPKRASWHWHKQIGQIPYRIKKWRTYFDPRNIKSLEVFSDANFWGNWHKPRYPKDVITEKFCTGYAIIYMGLPIIWSSKVQTHILLSTTEAKYTTLLQSLCNLIPVMLLLQ